MREHDAAQLRRYLDDAKSASSSPARASAPSPAFRISAAPAASGRRWRRSISTSSSPRERRGARRGAADSRWRTRLRAAEPNRGHRAVAELVAARQGRAASSPRTSTACTRPPASPDDKVIELHGNTTYATCLDCARSATRSPTLRAAFERDGRAAGLRRLRRLRQDRDDLVRPGDAGRRDAHAPRRRRSPAICSSCSARRWWSIRRPAFPELAKRNGAALAIVNREPTDLDGLADLVLREEIGETLDAD